MNTEIIEEEMTPVNELYTCIQGEGPLSGVPHILIRTVGCKLRCQFKNSFCDTSLNSWKPEKPNISWEEIIELYNNNPQISHTMITGGGPTLHPEFLKELTKFALGRNHVITIETEGSEYVKTSAQNISLSPKLRNSTPRLGSINNYTNQTVTEKHIEQHEKWRCNYDEMKLMIKYHHNFWLKFVVSEESDLEEIKNIILKLGVMNHRVYLMPEGVTDEQLQQKRQWLFEVCIKEGFNYSDRLHVIAFGDKRGV